MGKVALRSKIGGKPRPAGKPWPVRKLRTTGKLRSVGKPRPAGKPKVPRKKRSTQKPFTNKKKASRKLFEDDDDEISERLIPAPDPKSCDYCGKEFSGADFRDEHQEQCLKGPKSQKQPSLADFMSSMGMLAGPPAPPIATPSVSSSSPPKESPDQPSRILRKLPARNPALKVFNGHLLPITTDRGQKLIKEHGDPVDHRYPPAYEKHCVARSGFPLDKTKYRKVRIRMTKRSKYRHTTLAHMYSYGRRQRVRRYIQLVVGTKLLLNTRSQRLLDSCKKPNLSLEKLDPEKVEKYVVPPEVKNSSYLERQWYAAIKLPRIKLEKGKRYDTVPTDTSVQPRAGSPKPGTSKSCAE